MIASTELRLVGNLIEDDDMESNLEKLTKQLDSGVDTLNRKTALLLVLHNQNLTTIIELRERIDKLEKQRRPWFLRILGL